ncbi:chemotaxis protein CheB [Legionella sp. km772]|uniref:chemotaxis protein CheB n=1 Tax=Legionella sp. km772 TaxID=2498111 RepID=UPI000F8E7EAA|nr:chemotaxis protein CheB [Legionella sp. km772]RUR04334.1 chemotaxis protein CheB [Legionella sp. km772]
MLDYYLIVIGSSAGGLNPLKEILSSLPKDFPAAILIVKHIAPSAPNLLGPILSRISNLPVIEPSDNQSIEQGHIYIAPPNFHMIVKEGKIKLEKGPRVNHSIPAIDPLLYSAALYNKHRTIGVLLSGMLDDGSAGLLAVKRCKGISIVQDLNEAEYSDMPRNGASAAPIDYCLPAHKIEAILKKLVGSTAVESISSPSRTQFLQKELEMNFTEEGSDEEDMNEISTPSVFSCPECNGVLWRLRDKRLERYRCRVGHAYGLDSLMSHKQQSTQEALWVALRALEEKKNLARNVMLARSGDLEQNSGKIRAIPGLLVHSPYSQNGLSTSP